MNRRQVAAAGHHGDVRLARAGLAHPDAAIRATALGALKRCGALTDSDIAFGLSDESAVVRRRACEVAVDVDAIALTSLLADADDSVVHAAAWALGERGAASLDAVEPLSGLVGSHRDPLVREAAVAALGAIGDPRGMPAILAALTDKPAIRRRAVIALAPFEGPEVDAALERALNDRDWQVRQAAEDLTSA